MNTTIKNEGYAFIELVASIFVGTVMSLIIFSVIIMVSLETYAGQGVFAFFIAVTLWYGIVTASPRNLADWFVFLSTIIIAFVLMNEYVVFQAADTSFYELYLSNIF